MTTITIEVPDELADALSRAGDRLPELLALSLQQPALPAHIYRYILDFLASQPPIEQLAAFGPTPEMTERLQTLLARQVAGKKHDKKAADEEEIAYPTNATLDKDTGFQGYEPASVLTQQPKKNPKARS